MPGGIYRVTLNGFIVNTETWDDALEWDGKGDEVFTAVSVAVYDAAGTLLYPATNPRSPVMGDTNRQNGRIAAGSRSPQGGLRTGDSFPSSTPWIRGELDVARNYPPHAVWSGDLVRGGNAVTIIPSIWEWDPGEYWLGGWFKWADATAERLGPKIKELLGAGAGGAVDAVALGLDAAVSLFSHEIGPFGNSGSRPIGMRMSVDTNKYEYVPPVVLVLSYDTAELLVNSDPSGRGRGVLEIAFDDDNRLRGRYSLFVQVEKTGVISDPGQQPPRGRYSLRSLNYSDHFLRHRNFLYDITTVSSPLDYADATFEIVPGLAETSMVSLRAVNFPDHYLRHEGFRVKLAPYTNTDLFRADSTFVMSPGLASPAGYSFESRNYPGRYIRHRNFEAHLDRIDANDPLFRADATFFINRPLA